MNTYVELLDEIVPSSSDEDIVTAVLNKSSKIKRRRTRSIGISIITLVILTSMTITVGAVNDWDYAAFLRNIFNNNQIVADSIEHDANYRVINNTYDGLTFEMTGLYTDDESLFLLVEITSGKPIFNNSYLARGSITSSLCIVSEAADSEIAQFLDFKVNDFNYYLIDETRIVAVTFFTEPAWDGGPVFTADVSNSSSFREAVVSGREFSLLFGDVSLSDMFGQSLGGLPLRDGGAELRFKIDAFAEKNVLTMYPEIQFGNDTILKELRITPFSFRAYFSGNARELGDGFSYSYDYGYTTDISIVMNDGEVKPLEILNNGGGLLRSFSSGYHADHENISWIATFGHDQLIDLDNIVEVIFHGITIPVTR